MQSVREVTISLRHLIGGDGVQQTFPLPLNAEEQSLLKASAAVIRDVIDELERGI